MGTSELRSAFNEVSQPVATCTQATLGYDRAHDSEWQICTFYGTFADGTEFNIRGSSLRPGSDVMVAARDTAALLLKQRTATT